MDSDEKNGKNIARGCLKLKDKLYYTYDGLNTIGRNPDAIIKIKDLNVSKHHAIITILQESHYLSDLNSSNGTILDSKKLIPLKLYHLNDGSSIKFGDIFCTYKKLESAEIVISNNVDESQNFSEFYNAATQQVKFNNSPIGIDYNELPTQVFSKIDLNINEISTQIFDFKDKLSAKIDDSVTDEDIPFAPDFTSSQVKEKRAENRDTVPVQIGKKNVIGSDGPVTESRKENAAKEDIFEDDDNSNDSIDLATMKKATQCLAPIPAKTNNDQNTTSSEKMDEVDDVLSSQILPVSKSKRNVIESDDSGTEDELDVCNRKSKYYISDDSDTDIENNDQTKEDSEQKKEHNDQNKEENSQKKDDNDPKKEENEGAKDTLNTLCNDDVFGHFPLQKSKYDNCDDSVTDIESTDQKKGDNDQKREKHGEKKKDKDRKEEENEEAKDTSCKDDVFDQQTQKGDFDFVKKDTSEEPEIDKDDICLLPTQNLHLLAEDNHKEPQKINPDDNSDQIFLLPTQTFPKTDEQTSIEDVFLPPTQALEILHGNEGTSLENDEKNTNESLNTTQTLENILDDEKNKEISAPMPEFKIPTSIRNKSKESLQKSTIQEDDSSILPPTQALEIMHEDEKHYHQVEDQMHEIFASQSSMCTQQLFKVLDVTDENIIDDSLIHEKSVRKISKPLSVETVKDILSEHVESNDSFWKEKVQVKTYPRQSKGSNKKEKEKENESVVDKKGNNLKESKMDNTEEIELNEGTTLKESQMEQNMKNDEAGLVLINPNCSEDDKKNKRGRKKKDDATVLNKNSPENKELQSSTENVKEQNQKGMAELRVEERSTRSKKSVTKENEVIERNMKSQNNDQDAKNTQNKETKQEEKVKKKILSRKEKSGKETLKTDTDKEVIVRKSSSQNSEQKAVDSSKGSQSNSIDNNEENSEKKGTLRRGRSGKDTEKSDKNEPYNTNKKTKNENTVQEEESGFKDADSEESVKKKGAVRRGRSGKNTPKPGESGISTNNETSERKLRTQSLEQTENSKNSSSIENIEENPKSDEIDTSSTKKIDRKTRSQNLEQTTEGCESRNIDDSEENKKRKVTLRRCKNTNETLKSEENTVNSSKKIIMDKTGNENLEQKLEGFESSSTDDSEENKNKKVITRKGKTIKQTPKTDDNETGSNSMDSPISETSKRKKLEVDDQTPVKKIAKNVPKKTSTSRKRTLEPSTIDSDEEFEPKVSKITVLNRKSARNKREKMENDEIVLPYANTPPSTINSTKKNRRLSANSRRQKKEEETKVQILNSSLSIPERSRRVLKPKVVFTMMDNPGLESLIRQLGGSVVDSIDVATVLVTESIKRSMKLLCAVGQAKPICSPKWLQASKKANSFVDPWQFILIDAEAEKRWNFSIRESLNRSSKTKLLQNYTFQVILDSGADVAKGAIEACGGKCVTRNLAKCESDNLIIVSSENNYNKYSKIIQQNPRIKVVAAEAIFDGTLRQEFKFDEHLLT